MIGYPPRPSIRERGDCPISPVSSILPISLKKMQAMVNLCISLRHTALGAFAGLLFFLALCLTAVSIKARSRYSAVKISVKAPRESKASIDSLARSLPGVFSAEWSPHHQMLVVVYDHTVTTRKLLIREAQRSFQGVPLTGEENQSSPASPGRREHDFMETGSAT